jgi:hypothetical protein
MISCFLTCLPSVFLCALRVLCGESGGSGPPGMGARRPGDLRDDRRAKTGRPLNQTW